MKKFIYISLIFISFTSCKLLESIIEGETVYLPGDTLTVYITDTLEVIKLDTLEVIKLDTLEVIKLDTLEVIKVDTLEVIKVDTLEVIKFDTLKNNNFINLDLEGWELFRNNFKDSLVFKTYGILYLDTIRTINYDSTIFYRFNNIIYQLRKEN
jgi:hypothetical protein